VLVQPAGVTMPTARRRVERASPVPSASRARTRRA
jgi:hypothetical protein